MQSLANCNVLSLVFCVSYFYILTLALLINYSIDLPFVFSICEFLCLTIALYLTLYLILESVFYLYFISLTAPESFPLHALSYLIIFYQMFRAENLFSFCFALRMLETPNINSLFTIFWIISVLWTRHLAMCVVCYIWNVVRRETPIVSIISLC